MSQALPRNDCASGNGSAMPDVHFGSDPVLCGSLRIFSSGDSGDLLR